MSTELVHFDTARRALAEAHRIDEVKQIRDKAEALRQYIRQQGESLEMQNQAAEIKLRAERRAGEMLRETELQDGGDAMRARSQDVTEVLRPRLEDLGISKMQSHRWQTEASLPDEDFEKYVAETKQSGDELTSIGLYNLARQEANQPHVSHNTGNNEWYTPAIYIVAARQAMGDIDVDPASSHKANEAVKATKYYTIDNDGRLQPWQGNVWMNPPYAQPLISEFCELLLQKYESREVRQACVLVNNATETIFYQDMLKACEAVCFIKGRVRFVDEQGRESGAPLQGQTILYFGNHVTEFGMMFEPFGVILYGNNTRANHIPR